ncbi:predicted protein [Nematostella vectensis]|uniref:LicD/FKTN/FKRP nucleotidyltransferase domain-containing protein n=1 Tax=Nematostella vectensis TaxID=45351 RepID=A7S587_NEMVE|nr:predicted protein [Nematostella vectensis]|eukprot:XP_001633262.1 predicted protein [Nematostella vectensis]
MKAPMRCFLLTSLALLLLFYVYYMSRNAERSKRNVFDFELENIPYANLPSARCQLLGDNSWDCPDVRELGNNTLRQSQLVLLRLLLVFREISQKHNLTYWIARGTLLGAVRHKGMIPWDIDLDIVLPNEDYMKFLYLLKQEIVKLPEGVILQRHKHELKIAAKATENQNGVLQYEVPKSPGNPRFRDNKSCYRWCLTFEHKHCSWHDGLMVDIYPVKVRNGVFEDPLWSGYGTFRAFPLKELKFEGFQIPVIAEWERELLMLYGSNYMEIPSKEKQVPPDNLVPDPLHSCSDYAVEHSGFKLAVVHSPATKHVV